MKKNEQTTFFRQVFTHNDQSAACSRFDNAVIRRGVADSADPYSLISLRQRRIRC
ncbi:MAG: hypothetical protein GY805_04845 [Chloroflexi bacterium]|nr:hypothetical protein [Chloroflexota bacterium]